MKYNFKKILFSSLVITLLAATGSIYLEPVFAHAAATATDSVIVTLNVDAGITITSPPDTIMSTSLGVLNNTAIATTTWNVKTNSETGYLMTVAASTNPAMKISSTQFINDFATTSTPTLWSALPNGRAEFGYSAFGTDVATGTFGNDTSCGATSTPSTVLKYIGFTTSPSITIASRSATTTTSGVDTNICYAVQQKGVYVGSGVYTATITATATTQ